MRNYKEIIKIKLQLLSLASNGLANCFYNLDRHERETVINDTILRILEKENQGIINLDDFETYKNYAFISLKNHINYVFEYKKRKCRINNFNFSEEIPHSQPINYQNEKLKLDLTSLTQFEKSLFRWNRRGWEINYLAQIIKKPEKTVGRLIKKIKKDLYKKNIY